MNKFYICTNKDCLMLVIEPIYLSRLVQTENQRDDSIDEKLIVTMVVQKVSRLFSYGHFYG